MINYSVLGIIFIGSFIGSVANIIIKKSTERFSFQQLFLQTSFWLGLFLYGLATLSYLFALRKEELSVVYPLVSLTYVWTIILSVKYLNEKMNGWKYFSLAGIILGIVMIGMGS